MNITLWILQSLLAAMFAMAGIMKSTEPIDKLITSGLKWAERIPATTVRIIGILELLGAVGLILPMALDILPVLTPVAASGLALIMLLAISHHARHKEVKSIVFNIVLLTSAAIIAWGRSNLL